MANMCSSALCRCSLTRCILGLSADKRLFTESTPTTTASFPVAGVPLGGGERLLRLARSECVHYVNRTDVCLCPWGSRVSGPLRLTPNEAGRGGHGIRLRDLTRPRMHQRVGGRFHMNTRMTERQNSARARRQPDCDCQQADILLQSFHCTYGCFCSMASPGVANERAA